MILDAENQVWSAAALTSSAYSTNALDLGAPYASGFATSNIGRGEPLGLMLTVSVAADHTTGDETYQFEVVQAATSDLSSSPDTLITRVISYSLLTAGAVLVIPIPPNVTKEFIGAHYTGGGTTPTVTLSGYILPLNAIQGSDLYNTAIVID